MPDLTDNVLSTGGSAILRAVTPHATADLPDGACRALWVGGSGIVVLRGAGDSADVSLTVMAGSLVPVRARAVRSTSTATLIVALY